MLINTRVGSNGDSRTGTSFSELTIELYGHHQGTVNVFLRSTLETRPLQMGAAHPVWSSGKCFDEAHLYLAFVA